MDAIEEETTMLFKPISLTVAAVVGQLAVVPGEGFDPQWMERLRNPTSPQEFVEAYVRVTLAMKTDEEGAPGRREYQEAVRSGFRWLQHHVEACLEPRDPAQRRCADAWTALQAVMDPRFYALLEGADYTNAIQRLFGARRTPGAQSFRRKAAGALGAMTETLQEAQGPTDLAATLLAATRWEPIAHLLWGEEEAQPFLEVLQAARTRLAEAQTSFLERNPGIRAELDRCERDLGSSTGEDYDAIMRRLRRLYHDYPVHAAVEPMLARVREQRAARWIGDWVGDLTSAEYYAETGRLAVAERYMTSSAIRRQEAYWGLRNVLTAMEEALGQRIDSATNREIADVRFISVANPFLVVHSASEAKAQEAAQRILALYNELIADLRPLLPAERNETLPFFAIVFPNREQFVRFVSHFPGQDPDAVTQAVYMPSYNALAVFESNDPTSLRHELVHLIMDYHTEGLPVWFGEGLATLLGAGPLAEPRPCDVYARNTRQRVQAGELDDVSLQELMDLSHDAVKAEHYDWFWSFAYFLARERPETLWEAIRLAGRDESPAAAIENERQDELEAAWKAFCRGI